MTSKIHLLLDGCFLSLNEAALYKKVSELGFSKIILSHQIVSDDTSALLEKYDLSVSAILYENATLSIMDSVARQHEFNCPWAFIQRELPENYYSLLRDRLGLKLVFQQQYHLSGQVCSSWECFEDRGGSWLECPLVYAESPLSQTKFDDSKIGSSLKSFMEENPKSAVLLGSYANDIVDKLKHAKDMLNRLYFLGIR